MTSTPVPYNITNDNVIMLLFIVNIIGMAYVLMMNGTSIMERAKGIFYYQRNSTPFNDRTHITKICNALMYAQTIFYLTIITLAELQKGGLMLSGNALIYTGAFAIFFILVLLAKKWTYDLVNNILYTKKEAYEFSEKYLFTIKLLGFALAPPAIALLFVPGINTYYVHFYLILTVIAYIYAITNGLFRIISTKKGNYLEIFLYLCALEFLPIAMVWKSVLQLSEFITIKI
jgi:hypothetical protein